MKKQNYENHLQFIKGFHFILNPLLLIGIVISVINLVRHWNESGRAINLLLVLIFICVLLVSYYTRQFAAGVQDRAIRAEESLRYYIMTGKAMDSRLTKSQIIALRFAADDEYLALAERAIHESLSTQEIKMAVKNWRADYDRI